MKILDQTIQVWAFNLTIVFAMVLFSCSKDGDNGPVITSEGVFINEIYASGNDWIELFNIGDVAIDISGYFIYDDAKDKYSIPANTVIQPKGYLILLCDGTGTELHTNFKLSSVGEKVSLENAKNELIDQVTFPALIDTQSYARDPDGSTNLIVSTKITQGFSNSDLPIPIISNVTKTPLIPAKANDIQVMATVGGNIVLSSVKLYYNVDGNFNAVTMSLTSNNIYTATIPPLNHDGTVKYYIEATNAANKTALSPVDAPTTFYSYIINSDVLPNLVINEFMASNISCCPDTDGAESEYDDWIEIYNAGDVAVNIGGMHLSDDPTDPFKFKVPETNAGKTTIQPGGYLLIWADETKSQGELHANFKLNALGESVGLYYIDGRTIDQKTFDPQNDDTSYGRTSDGADTWKIFSSSTPGASNE